MKKMDDYIITNDFEGAYVRWKDTTKRWKSKWFEVLQTIYNKCKDWSKKYILDPIKKVVYAITEKVKSKSANLCYWIRLYGENHTILYNKIGTTTRNLFTRLNEIITRSNEGYYGYDIIRIWDCGDLPPEGLESELRSKLIKKYGGKNFVPNDRFKINNEFAEPTIEEMEEWATAYLTTA